MTMPDETRALLGRAAENTAYLIEQAEHADEKESLLQDRRALRALAHEVDALREEILTLRERVRASADGMEKLTAERDAALAEVPDA